MKPSSHDLHIFRRYLEAENQGCELLRTCTQAGVPEWHCGCARTWVGRWLRGPGKAWSLEGWILEHESIGSDKRPHSSGFSDAFTSHVLFSTAASQDAIPSPKPPFPCLHVEVTARSRSAGNGLSPSEPSKRSLCNKLGLSGTFVSSPGPKTPTKTQARKSTKRKTRG